MQATEAVKVLSVEESRQVTQQLQEAGLSQRILPSRLVRRWKPADQPGQTTNDQPHCSVRANRGKQRMANSGGQSEKLEKHSGRLYARQPKGGLPGLKVEQLEVLAGAYGLGDAQPIGGKR